eukprot:scaffold25116_cov69-Phaeocystis_antarctica.AAC.1
MPKAASLGYWHFFSSMLARRTSSGDGRRASHAPSSESRACAVDASPSVSRQAAPGCATGCQDGA